jgi:hypothetical protein
MAEAFPAASFVGADLSARQVADGRRGSCAGGPDPAARGGPGDGPGAAPAALLDGTRGRAELADAVADGVAGGRLHLHRDGHPVTGPAEVRAAVGAVLDQALENLARQGLLLA